MNKIYKYELKNYGITSLDLPYQAEILSAGYQDNKIVLWALVDENAPCNISPRIFAVYHTGDPLDLKQQTKFIQTLILDNANYILHVFEILK